MEEIRHFSHEHPLTFFEDNEIDDDEDHKPYFCSICGLPILSSPSYTCSVNGCNFFLHKPCAELPRELENPRYHPMNPFPHTVYLIPINGESGKLHQNFTYRCDSCKTNIHPSPAAAVEIKSKHKSHKSHPLLATCREIFSRCDACAEEHIGFFFSCQECDFWIHEDCTLLPSILKLATHPHSFILTYSLSGIELVNPECLICRRSILHNIGLYFCSQCISYAHVSCAKSNMENLETETRLELIKLPDEGDTFPSLVIRRHLESNPIPDHQDIKDDKKFTLIEKYHDHPLMFHDGIISSSSSSSSSREACLVCDVCIQSINISSPLYKCLQTNCHFLAHNICANLLSNVDIPGLGELDKASLLRDPSEWFFNSIFACFFCHRPCNGFCYFYDNRDILFLVDLECMVAPNTIKHSSHAQHVLFQVTLVTEAYTLTCCSGECLCHRVYKCINCDFCIHMRCALLPKRTRHKFDEHPLELITDKNIIKNSNEEEYCFCEVCEKDINQQYWFYHCGKCEQYFHINCIPSVGYLSKVKFGGTLNIPSHIHSLTLTRMLTVGSHQRCGFCNQIIQGFVDQMAFHCSECDFWIHFSCAGNSATDDDTSELLVYLDVLELTKRKIGEKISLAFQ